MNPMRAFLFLSALHAAAIAAAAQAAPQPPQPPKVRTSVPQAATAQNPQPGAPAAPAAPATVPLPPQFTQQLMLPLAFGWRQGEERLLLEIDADLCVASVGGKPLPADRVRRSGHRVSVLDSEGAVAAQVTLFAGGGSLQTFPERRRAALGVRLEPPDVATAASLGCQPLQLRRVVTVTAGQSAAKAGIQPGDLLLEIDGQGPVTEARLRNLLAHKQPGDELPLTIVRGGKRIRVVVRLGGTAPIADPLRPFGLDRQPYVAFEGGSMLVLDPRAAQTAPGTARGDAGDPVQELRAVQERLEKMERLLQQVLDLREKNERDRAAGERAARDKAQREKADKPRNERTAPVREKPPTPNAGPPGGKDAERGGQRR